MIEVLQSDRPHFSHRKSSLGWSNDRRSKLSVSKKTEQKKIKRSSKCYLLNKKINFPVVLNIYLRGRTFVLLTNRSLQLQTISNKIISPFRSLVHIQLYSIHNYRHPKRHIFCRLCSIIRKCIFKRLGQKLRTSNFT